MNDLLQKTEFFPMMRYIVTLFGILSICVHAYAQPLELEKVADGIYVHHGIHQDLSEGYEGDISNISFVIGSNGIAVIDTGGTLKTGQRFHQAIRQISELPILYVINTHVHPDHIYGNAAFSTDKPEFVGHHKLAKAMELRQEAYQRMHTNWMGDEFEGSIMIKPTLAVEDETTLDLGERQLKIQTFPNAHTDTDLIVIDSKTNTLWTGDLLFVERTPSIDGDIKGWIEVTQQLGKLNATVTIPGHGPVVSDLNTALRKQDRYLTTLLDDVRSSIQNGETMEQAMDTAAASEAGNWALFDTVNRRNVNLIYPVLEWE
jgi:quinoprotein relay system zinc metallohydrolase 2